MIISFRGPKDTLKVAETFAKQGTLDSRYKWSQKSPASWQMPCSLQPAAEQTRPALGLTTLTTFTSAREQMLRRVGFFKELNHGDQDGERLSDLIREAGADDEERIVAYLESGVLLVGTPGLTRDVLDRTSPIIGSPHTLTDGAWMWPADLSFYVKEYHVELPADFIARIRDRDYRPPESDLDIENLEY